MKTEAQASASLRRSRQTSASSVEPTRHATDAIDASLLGPRSCMTMSLFTVEEVIEIISARVLSGQNPRGLPSHIHRLCTDSREARSGDLFVALKGDRFDGHDFVDKALQQRSVEAIVQERHRLEPRPKGADNPSVRDRAPDHWTHYERRPGSPRVLRQHGGLCSGQGGVAESDVTRRCGCAECG